MCFQKMVLIKFHELFLRNPFSKINGLMFVLLLFEKNGLTFRRYASDFFRLCSDCREYCFSCLSLSLSFFSFYLGKTNKLKMEPIIAGPVIT